MSVVIVRPVFATAASRPQPSPASIRFSPAAWAAARASAVFSQTVKSSARESTGACASCSTGVGRPRWARTRGAGVASKYGCVTLRAEAAAIRRHEA